MIVVSNASPLITLARIGRFGLLRELFTRVHLPQEVWDEVVVQGAGRPASAAVAAAEWIQCHPAAPVGSLLALRAPQSLGAGELATVLLARSLQADLTVMDERAARRLAQAEGLAVMGCVGILETGHRRGLVTDLRAAYRQLLAQGIRVDRRILDHSLAGYGFPPL